MLQILKTLRDFLTEEQMKWLPGNLQAGTFMLLRQNKTDEKGVYTTVVQVFDKGGTYIGQITEPEWIPDPNK